MRLRECRPMPARALMPAPSRLPSLSDALARRAAIFGPFDLDEAPAASSGLWEATYRAARRVVASSQLAMKSAIMRFRGKLPENLRPSQGRVL